MKKIMLLAVLCTVTCISKAQIATDEKPYGLLIKEGKISTQSKHLINVKLIPLIISVKKSVEKIFSLFSFFFAFFENKTLPLFRNLKNLLYDKKDTYYFPRSYSLVPYSRYNAEYIFV